MLSYLYELPFGVGRRFVSSGVAARILEGWQVNGIYTAQSGQPFTPILAVDNSNTGQFFDRPDIVGDPYASGPGCPQTRTVDCWVNPAAFARPAPFTFGNAGRGSLRGPGYHNLDFSLVKNTPIAGGRMVQLRLEVFNVFNRPNFDNRPGPRSRRSLARSSRRARRDRCRSVCGTCSDWSESDGPRGAGRA